MASVTNQKRNWPIRADTNHNTCCGYSSVCHWIAVLTGGSIIVPSWSVLATLRWPQAQLVALPVLFKFPQQEVTWKFSSSDGTMGVQKRAFGRLRVAYEACDFEPISEPSLDFFICEMEIIVVHTGWASTCKPLRLVPSTY